MKKNLKLKAEIIQADMSELEVAREAKINYTRLSQIINGWVHPSQKEKEAISKILDKN